MRQLLRVALGLFALLFISFGVRWLAFPEGIAEAFGLELGDGLGLSSQLNINLTLIYLFIASLCKWSPNARGKS